jgi:hypothetical protein
MSNQIIVKGDDTFLNGVDLLGAIKLNTDLDLTGWKAKFTYQSAVLEFDNLTEKVIQPRFTANQTASFNIGTFYATLILYDAQGHKQTQFTNLPYKVIAKVVRDGN